MQCDASTFQGSKKREREKNCLEFFYRESFGIKKLQFREILVELKFVTESFKRLTEIMSFFNEHPRSIIRNLQFNTF